MATVKARVDALWDEFRYAVNISYDEGKKDENVSALRDYAEDISMFDRMCALLGRETANERRHRSGRSVNGFSVESASKLILMGQALEGCRVTMPLATMFLVCRQTAIEAQVIGFLSQRHLTTEWREAVKALDYAQLMKGAA